MKKKIVLTLNVFLIAATSWAVTVTSYYKPSTSVARVAQLSTIGSVNLDEASSADFSVNLASLSSQYKQNRRGALSSIGAGSVSTSINNNGATTSGSGIWTSTGKKNPLSSVGSMVTSSATVSASAIHTATAQNGPTTTYDGSGLMSFASGPKGKRPTQNPIGGLTPVGDAMLPLLLLACAFTAVLAIRRKADKDIKNEI